MLTFGVPLLAPHSKSPCPACPSSTNSNSNLQTANGLGGGCAGSGDGVNGIHNGDKGKKKLPVS